MNRNGSTSKPHTALLGRPPRRKKTEAPPIVTSALGPPPPDLADAGRDFWNAYRAEREPLGLASPLDEPLLAITCRLIDQSRGRGG
jgi:hypothetical protein